MHGRHSASGTRATMATKWFVMRHGQTVMNAAGLLAGSQSETPLTDLGKKQARIAGKQARQHDIDAIVCSTQGRARETAIIIAAILGIDQEAIIYTDLLIERDFGSLEGTAWNPNLNTTTATGIEPESKLIARAQQCVETYQNAGRRILLVTHGSTARALQCIMDPRVSFKQTQKLENAEIIVLS